MIVFHEFQEIKEGSKISRAQLYRITHTNKDGKPVDEFCKKKIVSNKVVTSFVYLQFESILQISITCSSFFVMLQTGRDKCEVCGQPKLDT